MYQRSNDDDRATNCRRLCPRLQRRTDARGNVASTETQVAECRKKAAKLSLPVASDASGMIVQEQHSGADLRWEGTAFMGLVRRAERHEFTDLLCLDVDRFCRGGPAAFWEQIGHFESAGVTVHWVLDDIPADIPFRGTILTARAEAAQWQRDKTREASARARTEWAKQSNIVHSYKPPFGFQFVYDETRHTRRNRPVVIGLVPDPVTGKALLHITQHVANGGSLNAAKAWLEAQHIPAPRNGLVWCQATLSAILHNPTNYGARRSFRVHDVERPDAARRAANRKTKMAHTRVSLDAQHPVDPERITPISGLTEDLWRRALAQLEQNKQFAARHAVQPEEQRAEHALLFGGAVRCAVCKRGLRVRTRHLEDSRTTYHYTCTHWETPHQGTRSVQIDARLLDGAVWSLAVYSMRDPSFFERWVANDDGPAVRVASLRTQLADLDSTHGKLYTQLQRLEADDPLVLGYQDQLRRNLSSRIELEKALEAAQKKLDEDTTQRATLAAFREYAASQSDMLDQKTPMERRRILLAMRTRCTVASGEGLGRVLIRFDLRGLPGASQAFGYPEDEPEEIVLGSNTDGDVFDLSTIPSAEILGLDDDDPPVNTLPVGPASPDPSQPPSGVPVTSLYARTPGGPASHAR